MILRHGDNWSYKSCKVPVKSSPPTNQHPTFHRPDALPVAQPTASKHWREKLSLSLMRLKLPIFLDGCTKTTDIPPHQQCPHSVQLVPCTAVQSWTTTVIHRVPTLLLTKQSRTFPGPPWKIFQDLFGAHECLNIKKKTTFTYNIQSVVHCRKFSMKQNVDVSCSEFRWTYIHAVIVEAV